MRKLLVGCALATVWLPAIGWQLQSLDLGERVRQASVILLGVPVEVLERKPTLFAGVGDELRIRVHVCRVLKGSAPEYITVRLGEVMVQTPPGLVLDSPRIWLINGPSDGTEFYAAGNFTSVLDSSNAAAVSVAVAREREIGAQ